MFDLTRRARLGHKTETFYYIGERQVAVTPAVEWNDQYPSASFFLWFGGCYSVTPWDVLGFQGEVGKNVKKSDDGRCSLSHTQDRSVETRKAHRL